MHGALVAWVLFVMNALQPSKLTPWGDTYLESAEAMVKVALEEPFFPGQPRQTLAWMISIGWHESRFNPRAADGHGAFCTFQIDQFNFKELGVTRESILSSPEVCTRAMSTLVRRSMRVCARHPRAELLGQYTGGGGYCDRGLKESRARVNKGDWIYRVFPLEWREDPFL